jgi:hypothetical protein
MCKTGLKNLLYCFTYMPTARLRPSKSVPSSRIKINVTLKIKKNCTEFAELGLTKGRGVLF